MLWKVTTWYLMGVILVWTALDVREHATHPYRWWLWVPSMLTLLWVSYLQWTR